LGNDYRKKKHGIYEDGSEALSASLLCFFIFLKGFLASVSEKSLKNQPIILNLIHDYIKNFQFFLKIRNFFSAPCV
jgi:hypothetical protein